MLVTGVTIAANWRDDIPGWPGLVVPSLMTCLSAFIPNANKPFRVLLAVTTGIFVYEASVEAYVYSSAAVMVAGVYCICSVRFKETQMHRKFVALLLGLFFRCRVRYSCIESTVERYSKAEEMMLTILVPLTVFALLVQAFRGLKRIHEFFELLVISTMTVVVGLHLFRAGGLCQNEFEPVDRGAFAVAIVGTFI